MYIYYMNKLKYIKNKKKSNKKNKTRQKVKNSKRNIKKIRRNTRRKYMKGGGNLNLSVDKKRFDIKLKIYEKNWNGIIEKVKFLIVTDTLTGKKYIVNQIKDDQFIFYIFEPDRYNILNQKFYVYYIDYNNIELPIQIFKRTEDIEERQLRIINNDRLSLDYKIDALSDEGVDYYINLEDYKYSDINYDDYNINIEGTLSILNTLNQQLKLKCPNLELRLSYYLEQPARVLSTFYMLNLMTLCLYNQENCISSIMCELEYYPPVKVEDKDLYIPNSFEISSETNASMERRKFNKLLRSVLIMISNQIIVYKKPILELDSSEDLVSHSPRDKSPIIRNENGQQIQYILSTATNPVSAWLLINYYNADILSEEFIKHIQEQEKIYDRKIEISQDLIKKFMNDGERVINTKIALTDENVIKASQEFNSILNSIDVKNLINCTNVEESWNSRHISSSPDMDLE